VASPYQQQAFVRKIVYIAIILVLAFCTYLLREAHGGIRERAETLGVQEESLGEVQLTDSMVRLTLTGSRGFAVCCLWLAAQEKQKKHEWNELEVLVDSLIKLQPHFVTPWLFQSWNLAYNVSVESDRVKDKYFYIARGINLIAEGCRINKLSPDMRYTVGFYNQHKIGLADEFHVLRCLYQMSAIDPKERDPRNLLIPDEKGRVTVNLAKFEQFCQQHPMLVRRLREFPLNKTTPSDIVDFLAENQKIPSMYEDAPSILNAADTVSPLKPADQRFPCLAPVTEGEHADPAAIDFDNYRVSRDWYAYSVQLMPPADPILRQSDPPYDITKYRMPRFMSSIIFRQYPARAQTYAAETLEKEGWFDRDGWKITGDWFPDDKFSTGKDAVVGDGVNWALRAWSSAHQMWKTHGEKTGLYLEPEKLKSLAEEATPFRAAYNLAPYDRMPPIPEDNHRPELDLGQIAHDQLYWLIHYQRMTNYLHFYYSTQVEQDPKCIELRRAFFQANQYVNAGERESALEIFQVNLPKWRDLLLAHKEFRQDDDVQEATFELVWTYLDLVHSLYGNRNKQLAIVGDLMAQLAQRPPLGIVWMPPPSAARDLVVSISAPIGKDSDGADIIPNDVVDRVLERRHVASPRRPPAPPPDTPPPPVSTPTVRPR
jgi:hypothetical protein